MLVMSIVNMNPLIATMGRGPRYVKGLSCRILNWTNVLAFLLMKTTNLAMGFPANVCPPALATNVCSSPIVPQPKLLDTVCPFSNNNFINAPLRCQPANPSYIQCHYTSSECYYDVCFIHSDDRAYL